MAERDSKRGYLKRVVTRLKKLMRRGEPELPEDPYAWVTAPKKPRPPYRSAAAVVDPPE